MDVINDGESSFPGKGGSKGIRVELSIDDAVDAIQFGKFQKVMVIAVGLCFMSDAMEVVLLGFLSATLKFEWDLSSTQAAAISASVFLGEVAGSIVLGRLGDTIGRRKVFLAAAAIICVSGVATSCVPGYRSLVLARFVVGFGVGGLTVPFDIFAEFLPNKMRGKYLMLLNYYWTAGSIIVPLLAFLTIGNGYSWRVFVFLCSIPCVGSFVLCYLYVPESPRWLLAQGKRKNEALAILRNAADENNQNSGKIFPEGCILLEGKKESSDVFELFKHKFRKNTFLVWGLWICFGFAYYGTVLVTTRVFQSNTSGNNDEIAARPVFDYGSICISSVAELAGVSLSILTIDSWGRAPSQVLGYAGGGIFVFFMCMLSLNGAPNAVLTLVAFIARMFEMSASCVTWISTAEIYPTEIRSTGHSVANVTCRLSAFVCPFVVQDSPLKSVAFIMVFVHLLGVISASLLTETKDLALGAAAKEVRKKKKCGCPAGEPFLKTQTFYDTIR